jgi:tRNA(Ile)-lysidine synthetase-like protein
MKKIGMKGTSLISDLLTDAKIPHSMRKDWPLVCDSSGILWCYKCAISENALAKSDAHEIWKLELIEMKL